ncbi:Putative 4,5-dihydroxyphthalate dehydrogenase [Variovorax sp. PBL-H6]|uniref:Gfo/Idh/MocA family protein n=1 Tax=Variovorax sp. PBL-H6 TaxID=434009 RepID=UPI001315E35C|nr:Gfo/Idh/MocA family oxidoreductase [Variovorax sp. PBL-H6]VTU16229.1 Putative 4,5-dihydroxyphthalate dehydrogenase [Variovorax sp. PBL-H6]
MIELGIIGLGKWAGVLARAAASSDKLRITRGFSRSAGTRASFASDFGIDCPDRVEDLLADPALQGIILTVPNELHLEYALRCAEAGKHVYIEKPITQRLDEALSLRTACEAAGVRVFVGHCAKLLAGVQAIRQHIDAGELGDLCLLEGHFFNPRALSLTREDWRWYQDKAPGGPLSQIAIHQLDVQRFLGGPVASVGATSARRSPARPEVEDQWLLSLVFESGALGSIGSSWTAAGVFDIRVVGTRATMHYRIDQTLWPTAGRLHESATLTLQRQGQAFHQAERLPVAAGDMFQDELERFAEAIGGRPQPDFDADYGIEILGMVEAARHSDRHQGARVDLREFVRQGLAKGAPIDRNIGSHT